MRLVFGDFSECDEFGEHFLGGRAEPFGGDFGAGYFCYNSIWDNDLTVFFVDAMDAVEDGGEGELEEGGGFHKSNATLEIQFDDGHFMGGFVGAVDEVEAEREVAEGILQAVDGFFEGGETESGSSK